MRKRWVPALVAGALLIAIAWLAARSLDQDPLIPRPETAEAGLSNADLLSEVPSASATDGGETAAVPRRNAASADDVRTLSFRAVLDDRPVPGAEFRTLPIDGDQLARVVRGEPLSATELAAVAIVNADADGIVSLTLPRAPVAIAVTGPDSGPGFDLLPQDFAGDAEAATPFALQRDHGVRGTVRLADGQPAVGAQVTAEIDLFWRKTLWFGAADFPPAYAGACLIPPRTVAVDGSGVFTIAGLGEGYHIVRVTYPGYAHGLEPFVFLPQAAPIDFVLEAGATVRGQVIDGNGQPLDRAMVWVTTPYRGYGLPVFTDQVLTDAEGGFLFPGVPAQTAALTLTAHHAQAASRSVSLPRLGIAADHTVSVRLGEPVPLRGRVVDDFGGRPVHLAAVEVYQEPGGHFQAQLTAAVDGTFRFDTASPEATYSLAVHHVDHDRVLLTGVRAGSDEIVVTLSLRGAVRGKVTADGRPAAGGRARLWQLSDNGRRDIDRWTDLQDDGSFTFERVAAGNYGLEAVTQGYALTSRHPISVQPSHTDTKVHEIALTRGAALAGRVIDAGTSQPLADVSVRLVDVDARGSENGSIGSETRTDGDGRYRIDGVPQGRQLGAIFSHAEHAENLAGFTIPPALAELSLDQVLSAGGAVSVTMLKPDGTELRHMRVELSDPGQPVQRRVTQTGRVVIERLAPGRRLLTARARSDADPYLAGLGMQRHVDVAAGVTTDVVFSTVGTATVSGTISGAHGELGGGRVFFAYHRDEHSERRFNGFTDQVVHGTFRLFGVEPGLNEIWIRAMDAGSVVFARQEIMVRAGEDHQVKFHIGGERMIGRVSSAVGEPIAAADIRLESMDEGVPGGGGMRLQGTSQIDGSYEVGGLHVQRYRVRVTAGGFGTVYEEVEIAAAGVVRERDFILEPEAVLVVTPSPAVGATLRGQLRCLDRSSVPMRSAVPDAVGDCRFDALAGGRYELLVVAEPLFPALATLDLVAGAERRIAVPLRKRGDLSVLVRNGLGVPVPGIGLLVTHIDSGETSAVWLERGFIATDPPHAVTGADGVCMLRGLPIGELRVAAEGSARTITLEGDEGTAITLTVP